MKGKSPYLNDCYHKLIGATQASTTSNGLNSNTSSAKSQRKTKGLTTKESPNQDALTVTTLKQGNPVTLAENMKIIAAI